MSTDTLAYLEAASRVPEPKPATTTPVTSVFDDRRESIIRTYTAGVAKVKAELRLTPQARQELIDDFTARAKLDLETAKAAEVEDTQKTIFGLQKKLLDQGHIASSDAIAARDALDRADRVTDAEEAQRLMAQATSISDHVFEKALLKKAYDNRWVDALNTYSSAHKNLEADADRLWDLTHPKNEKEVTLNAMNDSIRFTLPDASAIPAAKD